MTKGNIDTVLAVASIASASIGTWFINNALGLTIGLGGLFVQVYFNQRKDRREERELKLKEKQHEKAAQSRG